MPENKRLTPTWLHFQLWHALVFTALVAALFGAGQLVERAVNDLPDAPRVPLAFAQEQIAVGNVVSMKFRGLSDVIVGYAELSSPTSLSDAGESSSQAFLVALRRSDGSVATVYNLLRTHDVPFLLTESDRAFTRIFPLVGTGVLILVAVGLLRFRNRRQG